MNREDFLQESEVQENEKQEILTHLQEIYSNNKFGFSEIKFHKVEYVSDLRNIIDLKNIHCMTEVIRSQIFLEQDPLMIGISLIGPSFLGKEVKDDILNVYINIRFKDIQYYF